MAIFRPDIYKKNVFEIDYKKLKEKGIKCLVFDLDNTLGLIDEKMCPKDIVKMIKKLKKDFAVFISSNNTYDRIKPYIEELEIEGVSFSMKPLPRGLMRVRKKTKFSKKEIVMIGDQIVTDIFSGKLYGVMTILVDPLGVKDLKITGLNRKIENIIVKRYEGKGLFKKGNYYE